MILNNKKWKEYKLGNIAKFSYGVMPKKEKLGTGIYPTFSGYKYQFTYPEYNCEKGDIIIVARGVGGTGDVKIVKDKCYLTNLSIKIDFDKKTIINSFFYYQCLPLTLRHLDSGSAQSQITIADLGRVSINLPPLPEQRAIAEILSSIDDKIELNNQMNRTLEAMAQAIFKQWFVDFEFPLNSTGIESLNPLPGERVRDSAGEVTYKSSGGKMIDSELGPIPEGWRVGILVDEFNITMGQSPPGTTYNNEGVGIPFFQGRTDFNFRFPDNRIYCTEPKRFADRFDTLVSVRAPVGDMNMASDKCCIGRGLAAVRHKKGLYSYTYYKLISLMSEFKNYEHTGTVFGSINKEQFEKIKIFIPDEKIIDKYSEPGNLDIKL